MSTLQLVAKLAAILVATGPVIDQLKQVIQNITGLKDLQKAVELQTSLAEQLENQLKIVESALVSIQKSMKILAYFSYSGVILAILALVLWIVK
jgi:hypothetical protein